MRSLSPIPASDGSARLGSSPLRQSRRLEKPEGFLTPNGVGWAHRTRLSTPRRQGKASLVAPVARSQPTGPPPGLYQQPQSATAHVPQTGPGIAVPEYRSIMERGLRRTGCSWCFQAVDNRDRRRWRLGASSRWGCRQGRADHRSHPGFRKGRFPCGASPWRFGSPSR